jgi:arylsulfatase A-like enzyme
MKPNILIVMTDQQRHDLRKAAGFVLDTMPFLDSWFAEGGVDFARAYTPNPTCLPARVSMFTGRYPSAHQSRTNHNARDARYSEDLLDLLKRSGYRTALLGKNHTHRSVEDFDFAEPSGHLGSEGNHQLSTEERQHDNFLKTTDFIDAPGPAPGGVEVQLPYRTVTSALNFIDSTQWGEKPFFAWVSIAEPHNPYQVCEPYYSMFRDQMSVPLATGPEVLAEKGERFAWIRSIWERVLGPDIDERIAENRATYLGMLRLIDDQFKRLIGALEERGVLDNTIVLFLSDHGDFVGEYGLIRKGVDLPDVLTRIPMAWRGPKIKAQGRVDGPFVNIVDILPTLCDLIDEEPPFGVQGKSMKAILEGSEYPEKEFAVAYAESGFGGLYWKEADHLTVQEEGACRGWETFDCLNTWSQSGQVRMLCKGSFKIQVDMLGEGYLYNLDSDPMEVHNLFDDEAYAAVKADLLTELAAAMMRVSDPIPTPRRRYRTKVHPKGYWFDEQYISEDPGVRQIDGQPTRRRSEP